MSVSEGLKKHQYKTYHITLKVIDSYGNKTLPPEVLAQKIKIQPWTLVKELKSKISAVYGIIIRNIRLFFDNLELIDELTMLDYNIIQKKSPEINYQIITKDNDFFIRVYGTFHCHLILKKLIEDITHGFMHGLIPSLLKDGTSGTYRMRNVTKDTIAMFKPIDEEAYAPNNQKGYVGKFGSESFRKGILSGEGGIREFAAFAIDDKGLFDVPPTTFVEVAHPSFNQNNIEMLSMNDTSLYPLQHKSIVQNFLQENISAQHKMSGSNALSNTITTNTNTGSNVTTTNTSSIQCSHYDNDIDLKSNKKYNYITKKYGSLQKFIKSTDVAANFSFSLYTKDEAHKIAVLDFRILNCDRNDENILVIKKKSKTTGKVYYRLIPIDHSLSFPDCLKIFDYELCWMGWDQAQEPFSEKMKEYIESIDIIADMERLKKSIKLRPDCWKMFRISNIVLKKGAELNLTLFEIGNLMYRLDYNNDTPSEIEILIEKTNSLYNGMNVYNRMRIFSMNEKSSDVIAGKARMKRNSRLVRTTSEPKLSVLEENTEETINPKLKRKEKEKEKEGDNDDLAFDSPFYEMYYHHFETFLVELIKKTYPDK